MTALPLMIPNPSYKTMKEVQTYQGRKEKFASFLHCTSNSFLRKILYYRQHGRCPKCGKQLLHYTLGTCVHHNSYDHFCQFPNPEISVHCPRKQGSISAKTPNCELCYFKNPEYAESCLEKLYLLHSDCHNDLHKDN